MPGPQSLPGATRGHRTPRDPPDVRLREQLQRLKEKEADVNAAQQVWSALLPTAKINTSEWIDAREAARKAVIKARWTRTVTRNTWRELGESLRRGLYDGDHKESVLDLYLSAELYFQVLEARGY